MAAQAIGVNTIFIFMYGNKYNLLIILLIFSTISFGFECNKRIGFAETIYNFELGIEANPDIENIRIGDTLWLNIDESVNLKDVRTGRPIDYGDTANLGSAIGFHKLSDSHQFTLGATQHFNFKLVNGSETNNADPTYLREYLFEEKNNRYLFKLGVIPKQAGTFRLFFSNAANVYRKNDKCTKASFTLNFKNTNQHYYLSPTYQGGTLVGGDYYFKVN